MTAQSTPSRVVLAWAELTRDLSPHAAKLVLDSIQKAINRGRYYDELQDAARHASQAVERVEHDHDPFRGDADPCPRCKAEARESELLCRLDGQVALLRGVRA